MNSPGNSIEIFATFERDLEGDAPAARLREIRDILDDPAYTAELIRNIKAINDPDVLGDILSRMRRLRRTLEERRERKKHFKDMVVQMGVAGGVGLVGGSIVAAASATFPLVVLIPVIGGAWMALTGFRAASRLDSERHICEQLSEQMTRLLEEVR